jgi:SAM-dependent methyltransferase
VAESAIERARALFRPDEASGSERDGYLDLLEEDLASTGPTQRLMLTRAVPAIYERYWRPALGRIAKGITGPGMADEIQIAGELLDLAPGKVVLDVACGPGNFSRAFAVGVDPDGLVVGIDASPTMLARGAAELQGSGVATVALLRGDATSMPFADASFDGACCFAALHLFDDPFAALDEMRRVLRPGGRIAILTSVRRGAMPSPLAPLVGWLSGMRIFGPDEITQALTGRGFDAVTRRLAGGVQIVGGQLPAA